ncbi:chemotaxis protein CheW [Malikia granosa]|uniref:Chemotaxis protein CheW n=1 Tax=Malikia granosa TaxID=263067 RepID=A0A2S9K478_9BURK|nr:chemotaxis protein CheW [Malikia granosa]PRD65194.1 chemotaxis protein CheW [Malikia granosa]
MTPQASTLPIDTFLPYMRDVVRCEQSLHELHLMWRMIESSAKMNCPLEARSILPTMAATRAGFKRLEQELVASLVGEKVANVLDAIGTQAQYVIDIVVRNLYERTADVGFLARDRELCAFVAGLQDDAGRIRERLCAYRSKYTVYDEIVLLDLQGNVLVHVNEYAPIEGSVDPLVAQTLATDGFVETFRATDLRPGLTQALIYSRRILHPDTGAVVGLLCLSFDFAAELAGIFRSHRDPEGRANMLLLDADNRVIASADPGWIPLGVQVPVNPSGQPRLRVHGGREYLVRTFAAEGYQGYQGPAGWQGQVMIPVDLAFSAGKRQPLESLEPALASGLLSHASSFSPPLYEIMRATETIRRVVWNGQVVSAGQDGGHRKLKSILEQISETGARSNQLFSQSISDLYETVLESNLSNAESVAHLLVDLLDRNLYERANDCRWWALTPELRAALALPPGEPVPDLQPILDYINQLYTVYSRLFVYDSDGLILASSHPEQAGLPGDSVVGQRLDPETLGAVLQLRSEQSYHVTPFQASPLSGGLPSYIYHAAIRDPAQPDRALGGIGIVFDAEREFAAMLRGSLGQHGGVTAFYIDRQARILSSTDPARPVGSRLEVDADLLALKTGQSVARIVIHDGHYAILGCSAGQGYREFKVSDGYGEQVLALVFKPLGEVRERGSAMHPALAAGLSEAVTTATTEGGREFATFFAGDSLLALDASHVLEALPASELTPMSVGGHPCRIGMLLPHGEALASQFVWVFDLGRLLHGQASVVNSSSQVIIVRHAGQTVGLLIDELHGVPEFSERQIEPLPLGRPAAAGRLVERLIRADGGRVLIQLLEVEPLFRALLNRPAPAAEAQSAEVLPS